MVEKGKISQFQLFAMIVLFLFGSTTIVTSINIAGRNTWISAIFSLFAALGIAKVIFLLSQKFPGQTLVEYLPLLLGRKLGKLVAVFYLWYFLHLGSIVLRNYGELLGAAIMPETPIWFFHLTLGLVTAFLIYNKLEVMGRMSELAFPFTIGLSLMTSLLLTVTGHLKWETLLPIFETGIKPIILGSIPLTAFPYGELIIFAMIIPYLKEAKKAKRPLFSGLLFGWIILFFTLTETLSFYGEYMATLAFPRFFAVRLISIGDFIERIEPLILATWLMAGLIKVGVCLYGFVLGFAQLFRISDYNFLVIPAITMMAGLANLIYENIFEMLNFTVNIYPLYAMPFQIGFPLLLLILATFKQKKKAKPAGKAL